MLRILSELLNRRVIFRRRQFVNVKNELQYLLVTDLLTRAAEAGFMTADELAAAKDLAAEKYLTDNIL